MNVSIFFYTSTENEGHREAKKDMKTNKPCFCLLMSLIKTVHEHCSEVVNHILSILSLYIHFYYFYNGGCVIVSFVFVSWITEKVSINTFSQKSQIVLAFILQYSTPNSFPEDQNEKTH